MSGRADVLLQAAADLARPQDLNDLCAQVASLGLQQSCAEEAWVVLAQEEAPSPLCRAARRGDALEVQAVERLSPEAEAALRGAEPVTGWRALELNDGLDSRIVLLLRYAGEVELHPPLEALVPHMTAAFQSASTYALLEEVVEHEMKTAVAREQSLQLILDSIQEGLLVCDLQGRPTGARSRAVEAWFPDLDPEAPVWTVLAGDDTTLAQTFELGFAQLTEGWLPFEVAAAQLPEVIRLEGNSYEIRYAQVQEEGRLSGVLLTVQDITARLVAEEAERELRELPAILRHVVRSPAGFRSFLDEADDLLDALSVGDGDALRLLHTLKGNAALYGFDSFARYVHEVEERAAEVPGQLEPEVVRQVREAWDRARGKVEALLTGDAAPEVRLSPAEHAAFVDRLVAAGADPALVDSARAWAWPRVGETFARLTAAAGRLAERLGRRVEVTTEGDEVRVPSEAYGPFLATLVHAVRNAVDHGVEPPAERRAAGKSPSARLRLVARRDAEGFRISISDDGRGVDWGQVASNALRQGIDPEADPIGALCAGSTTEAVTEVSGRGAGLPAMRDAAVQLGGRIAVDSEPGRGTTLTFLFPRARW